jgi:hypothetical protein
MRGAERSCAVGEGGRPEATVEREAANACREYVCRRGRRAVQIASS